MKKIVFLITLLVGSTTMAQEHFSGINISRRVGLLNASINPAELNNLSSKSEVNILNFSINVANNKVGFEDIINGSNIENKFFEGTENTDIRLDGKLFLPSFGIKVNKWAFGINSMAVVKANVLGVNTGLGSAITDNSLASYTNILSSDNQRINAVSWGEIGLTASRTLFENTRHKFNAGVTFKLLFPSGFMNLGITGLDGDIVTALGNSSLTNATAEVNIAYSGNLANSFENNSNYSNFFSEGLNGFGTEIGVNYQLKKKTFVRDTTTITDDEPKKIKKPISDYKLNVGFSVRNIGQMKFSSENNVATNYALNISNVSTLNLDQFSNANSITEIEQILLSSGYLTETSTQKDFTIKLPTVINLYADYLVASKLYISGYLQQKISDDTANDFTTVQNILTITPRFSTRYFEAYIPFSKNEISDFTTGLGFRVGGFFLGSGSIVTAVLDDSKQADVYFGFRFGL